MDPLIACAIWSNCANSPIARDIYINFLVGIWHQRVYTGEKLFQCEQCGEIYCERSTLINHQKVHTGEKLFTCDQCDNSFSIWDSLIRHKRVHTGEKPFSCDQCDKIFSERAKSSEYTLGRSHSDVIIVKRVFS